MSAAPPLTHEENIDYIHRAQSGDETALNLLAEGNLALVKSVVRRFLNRGVEYDDLVQLGSMGLTKAIKRFDTSLGVHFSTYAVPMIAGEIKRFLRDDGIVKVSRSVKELAVRASAVSDRLSEQAGRPAGIIEIAAELNESPEDVAVALDALRPAVSLNETVGDDPQGAERMDFLQDAASEECRVDHLLIKDLIGGLLPRERQIIEMRFFRDRTQSEIAEHLGVSQVQVSRLLTRILLKMRDLATGEADEEARGHKRRIEEA